MNKNTKREVTNSRVSARNVALMAIFATLSAIVVKVLPGIPIVGVSGANIKFDAVLAPIYGMVIGPYFGFMAALIGGLITAGSLFEILTSFSPAVSAMVAGFLTQKYLTKNKSVIKGWMAATIVLGSLIVGWYFTDVGRQAPAYPVLHIAGLALILIARGWPASVFNRETVESRGWHVRSSYLLAGIIIMVVAYMFTMPYASSVWILPYLSLPMFLAGGIALVFSLFEIGKSSFVLAVSIATYCGIIADHMLGNLVFITSINVLFPLSWVKDYFLTPMGLPDVPTLFMYMIPVSAVERILFTVVGTVLGVALILAIRKANLSTRRL